MNRIRLILILALSLICARAWADTAPTRTSTVGACGVFVMCLPQTIAGVCDIDGDTTGDKIVLSALGYSKLTFFSNGSVDNPWVCNVFGNDSGYDAESGDGVQLNTTALSNTQEAITLAGGNFNRVWVNCSTVTTSALVTVHACP